MLNELAHAGLGDAPTAEDLDGVLRGLLCGARAVHLQECDLAARVAA